MRLFRPYSNFGMCMRKFILDLSLFSLLTLASRIKKAPTFAVCNSPKVNVDVSLPSTGCSHGPNRRNYGHLDRFNDSINMATLAALNRLLLSCAKASRSNPADYKEPRTFYTPDLLMNVVYHVIPGCQFPKTHNYNARADESLGALRMTPDSLFRADREQPTYVLGPPYLYGRTAQGIPDGDIHHL